MEGEATVIVDAGATVDPVSDAMAEPEVARPSLLRNLAHLFSSQVITWTLATIVTVVLPRYLGPENLGQLRLASAIWMMTQLFIGLGTSTYLTLEMARNRERGTHLVGAILTLRLLASILVSAVLALIAALVGIDADLAITLALFGVGTLIFMFGDVVAAALTGLEQMSYPAMASVAGKVLYTVAVIIVLILDGGVHAVAATGVVSSVGSFAICWFAFRKFGRVTFGNTLSEIPTIVRASLAFFATGALLTIYHQIDTVIISALVDPRALGWYTSADVLFATLLFPSTILMAALFPRFGRLHVEDPPALDRLVRQAFSSLMLIGVPIGLGTAVVANRVTLLLYGPDYRESGPVLATYGIVIIIAFGTILFGHVAMATGRQRFWNLLMVTGIVASIPLDLVFVAWADDRFDNGAIGGALSYVVTESVMLVLGIWKVAPTVINRASLLRIGKILVAGGLMVAATWPVRDMFPLIPIVVGAIVYVGAILLMRTLTDDEQSWVKRGLAHAPRPSRRRHVDSS